MTNEINSEYKIIKKEDALTKKDDAIQLDERMMSAIEKIAEKAVIRIQKKDYRAETVETIQQGKVPDDVSTFMHIDETEKDELGNPRELDVKGTTTPFEHYIFSQINFATALSNLRDWRFFEFEEINKEGKIQIVRVPANLAQIDANSQKRLAMSRMGSQSTKHIQALNANSGKDSDGTPGWAKWLGFGGVKEK